MRGFIASEALYQSAEFAKSRFFRYAWPKLKMDGSFTNSSYSQQLCATCLGSCHSLHIRALGGSEASCEADLKIGRRTDRRGGKCAAEVILVTLRGVQCMGG